MTKTPQIIENISNLKDLMQTMTDLDDPSYLAEQGILLEEVDDIKEALGKHQETVLKQSANFIRVNVGVRPLVPQVRIFGKGGRKVLGKIYNGGLEVLRNFKNVGHLYYIILQSFLYTILHIILSYLRFAPVIPGDGRNDGHHVSICGR